ncbi:MAG TPA: glucose 1-dehydrogenase [Vicinamibacteria bacterium]|nr:glucose 1-dehydrogenase [Vicinamibacteria bacterium]
MKAVAVTPGARKSLHVREVAEPRPHGDHALVRVLETGVCGTDVDIDEGLFGDAPPGSDFLILGHENLGVVEDGAGALAAGDLVVATVRRPCPEACPACREDQSDMCLTGNYTERGIKGLHGFMAERYVESPRYLVRVDESLRGVAVLFEPMSVVEKGIDQAWRIQRRLPWEPRRALVLGAGPIGMLAALVLRLRGLDVTACAREPRGRMKERQLAGAGIGYVSTSETPIARLAERMGPADVVFEATGAPEVVFPATRLLARNGVCILASVTLGTRPIEVDAADWNQYMILGNRLVVGTVNAGREHFEAAGRDLQAAEQRWPGWASRLVTRRLPFTEAAAALAPTPGNVKTVVEWPA